MCPILFHLPAWPLVILAGATAGLWVGEGTKVKGWHLVSGSVAGAVVALLLGWRMGWLTRQLPIQGYGTLILCGFLLGVWMARRRSLRIGVDPKHCTDVGLWGVLGGLGGARLFHVLNSWSAYNPFGEHGLDGLVRIFAVWQGGLVFFGAFLGGPLAAIIYCRWHRLPVVPFLDMAAPSLIAGQAIGRLGCLMRGCCFGQPTGSLPALRFPAGAEVYYDQIEHGLIAHSAKYTLPVIPTQVYASIGAGLIAAFLYAYWPHRRFDGQVFGWLVVMAAVTRFLEEFLRADTGAAFPSLSSSLTIAQWFAFFLLALGTGWLIYFRKKKTLYQPPKSA
jgi:phosphatidylglycerol:prolipoprotein diacylglycerol transferase